MKNQRIIEEEQSYRQIAAVLKDCCSKKFLLVCGKSFDSSFLKGYMDNLSIPWVRFSDFSPNPTYESVIEGISLFVRENCDFILAVGGGSAMDVAKCIKLYHNMPVNSNFLEQKIIPNKILFMVLPTTAGTGSESTRFAVIYRNGEKQSVYHDSILPDYVILEPALLVTLPLYQKKCAMLDALCQAIESMWSIHSTEKSKALAERAIPMILKYKDDYLSNTGEGNRNMLIAANLAGQAINITQTTAAHAMSYKITSLFGLPHGHAVSICLPSVWRYIASHLEICTDARGASYLKRVLEEIANCMGTIEIETSILLFQQFYEELEMNNCLSLSQKELSVLIDSVNLTRLKNMPVMIDQDALRIIYTEINHCTIPI